MNVKGPGALGVLVGGGMAAGALVAAATPSKDESGQTKLTAALAGIGIVGGGLLMAASGRMPDGGLAVLMLGGAGIAGGIGLGGAALGSWLVDRGN